MKRPAAQRLGCIYADIMQTVPNKVTVAFRELAEVCGAAGLTTHFEAIDELLVARGDSVHAHLYA